jgi:ABC-type multidrug transport system permease subunit
MASVVVMQRRHETVLGLEGDDVDARQVLCLEARVEAGLKSQRRQGALGGVAFQLPFAICLAQAYARRLEGAARGAPASSPPGAAATVGIALDERAWFNPGLVSRHYNVPAVAGGIVFLMCLLLTALAVVRERELGTLEQLMVSPLRPFELIAGKTLPFMAIGLIAMSCS